MVSEPDKFASPALKRATVKPLSRNEVASPLKLGQMVLTDELLQTTVLDPLNRKIAKTREARRGDHHLGQVDINTFWQYITTQATGGPKKSAKAYSAQNKDERFKERQKASLGQQRFQVIHSHLGDIEFDVQLISNTIINNVRDLFDPANYTTVDETLLAYAGLDMIAQMIQVFIPRKPHPFGTLFHGAVMLVRHSKLPILVGWEWRYKKQKLTPTAALKKLVISIAEWNAKSVVPLTVLCDSGFQAHEVLSICDQLNIQAICSVSGAANSPYRFEYNLASDDLIHMHSRSFLSNGTFFQSRVVGDKPTVVATNFYVPTQSSAPKALETRERAIKLAQLLGDSFDLAWFRNAYPALPAGILSKYDIACFLCAEDVGYPEGTKDNINLLTQDSFNGMLKWQLDGLASSLKIKDPSGTVPQLIEKILTAVKQSQDIQSKVDDLSNGMPVENFTKLKMELDDIRGSPTTCPAPMVLRYCELFNGQDRVNRTFYNNVDLSKDKTLNGIQLHNMLWNALYNAYVAWIELVSESPHLYVEKYHIDPTKLIHDQISLGNWLNMLHEERHSVGLKRKCSRPTLESLLATPSRMDITTTTSNQVTSSARTPPSVKRSKSRLVENTLERHSLRLAGNSPPPTPLMNATPTRNIITSQVRTTHAIEQEEEQPTQNVKRSLFKEFDAITHSNDVTISSRKRQSPYRKEDFDSSKVSKQADTHVHPKQTHINALLRPKPRLSPDSFVNMMVDPVH